jgi:hypothetical protein
VTEQGYLGAVGVAAVADEIVGILRHGICSLLGC